MSNEELADAIAALDIALGKTDEAAEAHDPEAVATWIRDYVLPRWEFNTLRRLEIADALYAHAEARLKKKLPRS